MSYKYKIFNKSLPVFLAAFAILASCRSKNNKVNDSQGLTNEEALTSTNLLKDDSALKGTSLEDILVRWFPKVDAEQIITEEWEDSVEETNIALAQVGEDLKFLSERVEFKIKNLRPISRINSKEGNNLKKLRDSLKKEIPESGKKVDPVKYVTLAIALKKALEENDGDMQAAKKALKDKGMLEETINGDKQRIEKIENDANNKDLSSLEGEKREKVTGAKKSLISLAKLVVEFNKAFTDYVNKKGENKIIFKK